MADIQTLGTAEVYLPLSCGLGEGPFYEEGTGELRFVDIMKKEIHSINLEKGPSSHEVTTLEDSVGITADIESHVNEYIVAAKQGFAIFSKEDKKLRYVKKTYEDDPVMADRMRFNDGAVDSSGRFWAGTMYDFHSGIPQQEATIFRLDPDGTLHRMIEGVCIPNGLGWSLDDTTMYVTESPNKIIYAYDYESRMGSISNKRIFFQLDPRQLGMNEDAVPDGCSMDAEGYLWVAIHGGGRVLRISPSGKVVGQVHLPTLSPTCPCFGGKDLDVLFITSSGGNSEPRSSTTAGNLFCFKTSTTGSRSNKFVMSSSL